jgi:hypothetical protein
MTPGDGRTVKLKEDRPPNPCARAPPHPGQARRITPRESRLESGWTEPAGATRARKTVEKGMRGQAAMGGRNGGESHRAGA